MNDRPATFSRDPALGPVIASGLSRRAGVVAVGPPVPKGDRPGAPRGPGLMARRNMPLPPNLTPALISTGKPEAGVMPALAHRRHGWALALSSVGHATFLAGAVYAAALWPPQVETAVPVAQISLVSEARFQAMTSPKPAVPDSAAALSSPPPTDMADPAPMMPEGDVAPAVAPVVPPTAPVIPLAEAAPKVAGEPSPEPAPAVQAKAAAPAKPKAAAEPKPQQKTRAKAAEPIKSKPKQPEPDGSAKPASKGQSGADTAGKPGIDAAATPSKGQAKQLKATWGSKLRNRIERHKKSPKGGAAASGTVKLRLTVARSGALMGVSVIASSGHQALDAAAVRAVKSAAPFPAAPKGLDDASYSFTLPVKFAN